MNIIFGAAMPQNLDNYTVLELDTIQFQDGHIDTAYCVVEQIPVTEFPLVAAHKKIHHDLMEAYRNKHWHYCHQAIEGLMGKWGGEVDSFYTALEERIQQLETQDLPEGWVGTIPAAR